MGRASAWMHGRVELEYGSNNSHDDDMWWLERYELRLNHVAELEGEAFGELGQCGGLQRVVADDCEIEESYPHRVMSLDEGLCDERKEFMQHG